MKIVTLILIALAVSCASMSDDMKCDENNLCNIIAKSDITKVVLLGTGTPNAHPERSGSGIAIVVNEVPYIIDCGPGVVRRAVSAWRDGVSGLAVERLNYIFFTHLHSDHTAGYPDFLLTPWVLERKENVEAFGPPGLLSMTDHILKAYEQDIQIRIHGPEHARPEGITVNVHEFKPGIIHEDNNVKVTAFPVKHGAWKHAYGFRFETPDRVIVISGDAVPSQELIDNAMGCDILIHEVYSKVALERRPPQWQAYHKASHTSTVELAEIANQVKPKLLVLYHQLYWGTTDEELVEEIKTIYKGKVVSGKDLDVF